MGRTAVINVVGLTQALISEENTPFLTKWVKDKVFRHIKPSFPAVTTTAQMNYFTSRQPNEHGIVGNGWKFIDEGEVKLWRQSSGLVKAPKIWDILKDEIEGFTCANLFGWYNMYTNVDYAVTPRPQYAGDGAKYPDIYAQPQNLRDRLKKVLGEFPLFDFWGPNAGINSSKWISNATKKIELWYKPTLNLIYLPHLDYDFQRFGPNHHRSKIALQEIDKLLVELITFLENEGVNICLLSEYGIQPVSQPIHLNRLFRKQGWLDFRLERGGEYIEPGNCEVFALADHQIAHIYLRDKSKIEEVRQLVESDSGVFKVLDKEAQKEYGLDHDRSGDLVAIAHNNAWFTYYYWENDDMAPDFARCVDIHKKPGYDPVELFMNPDFKLPLWEVGKRLIQKKLGLRYLMDVIPLKAELVKGSHGSPFCNESYWPVWIGNKPISKNDPLKPQEIFELIKQEVLA